MILYSSLYFIIERSTLYFFEKLITKTLRNEVLFCVYFQHGTVNNANYETIYNECAPLKNQLYCKLEECIYDKLKDRDALETYNNQTRDCINTDLKNMNRCRAVFICHYRYISDLSDIMAPPTVSDEYTYVSLRNGCVRNTLNPLNNLTSVFACTNHELMLKPEYDLRQYTLGMISCLVANGVRPEDIMLCHFEKRQMLPARLGPIPGNSRQDALVEISTFLA